MWKDILKKNAISIACGVVALIALIATIWPADGWVADLQANLDARKSAGAALNTLATKSRYLPNLNPNSTEQIALKQFPSQTIITRGQEATQQMKGVSDRLLGAAVDINQRPLLVPGSLPRSNEVRKFDFRAAYALALALRPPPRMAELPAYNIPVSILNATQPPTPEDITVAQDALWADKYVPKIVTINGQAANAQQVSDDFIAEAVRLPDVMRQQKAEAAKIYLMPGALTEHTVIAGGSAPREEDIWIAQLGLWIQQDVARAIAAANAGAQRGVIDAPVKQLLQLTVPLATATAAPVGGGAAGFPGMGMRAGMPPGMSPDGADAAAAATAKVSDPAEAITFDYATTPTGRVRNGLYDVHAFVLVVDVDAAQLANLLTELTRDRYLAVHSINMEPVDLKQLQAAGFMYGSRPVVRATLQCEILYLRKWTEQYMPESIKAALGIATPPPATPGA